VSDVLHRITEIDPRSETTRRSIVSPSVSLNAFRAIENDFFDRAVLDGGGFQAGGKSSQSLDKDAPVPRPIQPTGSIKSHPILGGLHHHYVRV
jgi:hypothetical protein